MITIYYDGSCGLCHHFVRFLLVLDAHGEYFRFAPLGGQSYRSKIPKNTQKNRPDSIVVLEPNGNISLRSRAVFLALGRLPGFWGGLSRTGKWLPRPVADWAYDQIAWIRRRLFGKPSGSCPITSHELRKRFDD